MDLGANAKVGFKRLQYVLLPARCPPGSAWLELHDAAFRFWRDFWSGVFAEISPGEAVNVNDFHRQNAIAVFLDGDRVAALHLYSLWNLSSQSALAQPYIASNYRASDLDRLRQRGVRSALAMEYLTVDPAYRKGATGLPMSSLVIGVGYEATKAIACDAMIAPCRMDVKVHQRVAEFGAVPISEPFVSHGVQAINMVAPVALLRGHSDPSVAAAVADCWSRRQDLGADLPWIGGERKIAA